MIDLVGFDGDDTLWHSEGYYQHAGVEFERIMARYVDVRDALVRTRLHEAERRNLALFGYGAKSMALSMVEAAIELSHGRIGADDIHRIIALGKAVLEHPVELLPGMRAAVEAVAARWPIVLITKGDLFHQESKVAASGVSELFEGIEIVAEKDVATYRRVVDSMGVPPERFAMVGNSVKSDVLPVLELGGRAVHVPYHITWEAEHADHDGTVPTLDTIADLPAWLESLR